MSINVEPGRAITESYMDYARKLDKAIWGDQAGTVANWFHFAAWGTANVNLAMDFVSPEVRDILCDAELSIYHDVISEAERFIAGEPQTRGPVAACFCLYDTVRSYAKGDSFIFGKSHTSDLMNIANVSLAAEEQRLIDPHLNKIPDTVSILILPTGTFTVPQPWHDIEVRMPWIGEMMALYMNDPAMHRHPYEATE